MTERLNARPDEFAYSIIDINDYPMESQVYPVSLYFGYIYLPLVINHAGVALFSKSCF